VIDTRSFVDQERLAAYADDIAAAQAGFRAAIAREIYQLALAKRTHDELERYYVPHMDFAAVEQRRLKTLSRILELVAERQPISVD
jgi:hypothetical protein